MRLASRWRAVASTAVAVGATGLGCAGIIGVDDWSAEPSGGRGSLDAGPDALAECEGCGADACVCAPAAPDGWEGVDALVVNPAGDPCSAPYTATVADAGAGRPVIGGTLCSGCTCTAAAASCPTITSVQLFAGAGCSGAMMNVSVSLNNGCHSTAIVTASHLVDLAPFQPPCTAGGGVLAAGPAVWQSHATLCSSEGAPGCAGGGICAARLGASSSPCIHRAGDVACPAGAYTERTILFASLIDTRGCSTCTCGAPTGGVCTTSIHFFSDDSCMSPIGNQPTTGACGRIGGMIPVGGLQLPPAALTSEGTCATQGGEVTGTVEGAEPTTVCCVPQ